MQKEDRQNTQSERDQLQSSGDCEQATSSDAVVREFSAHGAASGKLVDVVSGETIVVGTVVGQVGLVETDGARASEPHVVPGVRSFNSVA